MTRPWSAYTVLSPLTHWGRVTHKCISNLTIIGSENGLSPGRHQALFWTIAGILSIRTLGTNFNEILSEIHTFSFKKMHLKMLSAKWRPICLSLNMLNTLTTETLKGCFYGFVRQCFNKVVLFRGFIRDNKETNLVFICRGAFIK